MSKEVLSCKVVVKIDDKEFHSGSSCMENARLHEWSQTNQHCLKQTLKNSEGIEETSSSDAEEGVELLFNPKDPLYCPDSKNQFENHEKPHGIAEVKSFPKYYSDQNHPANCLLLAGTNPYNKWLGNANE